MGGCVYSRDVLPFGRSTLPQPNLEEVRRFRKAIKHIEVRKEVEEHEKLANINSIEDLASLEKYNVLLEIS